MVTPNSSASTLVVEQVPSQRRRWWKIKGRKSSASPSPARTAARASSESRTRRDLVPGLDTPEQREVSTQMAEEAAAVASSVNYFKKMAWARQDMDKLKSLIGDIRDCNNDLGSFIESIAVKDVQKILPSFPQCENMWPMITQVENALYLLHRDLMDINVAANGQGPFFFAVQLFEDHGDNRADLENVLEGHLRLCEGSYVFNLQKHASEQMNDAATDFLIVESTRSNPERPPPPLVQLERLYDLSRPQAVQNFPAANIERWGYFGSSQPMDTVNILYRSTSLQWASRRSLRDILQEPYYRTRMTPIQITQLARLVLCAQLYLARVLRGHPRLRPESYRYYQSPVEQDEWDNESPLVLSPYLAIGLGRRPPAPVMGARRGISQAPSTAMMETGLVLYQLGTGEPMDYGVGLQALQEVKNNALRNLEVLDRRVGAVYSEVVHEFLEFNQPAPYLLSPEDERQASEQIKRSISALMSLEQSLTNTVTTAIAFPVTAQPITATREIAVAA